MRTKVPIYGILILILLSSFVSAQAGGISVPHQFFGSVTGSNGNPAPDGVLIVARINGKDVGATTTKNGFYGYNPKFIIPDPQGNRQGDDITFFANSEKVGESVFINGESTRVDLITSVVYPAPNPPAPVPVDNGGSSGGGGGGGGGGGSRSGGGTNVIVNSSCTEYWECSEWLDCIDNVQKRVCTDRNSCATELNKPLERQDCISSQAVAPEQKRNLFSRILGAVVGVEGNRTINIALIVAFFIAILIILMVVRAHMAKRKTAGSADLTTIKVPPAKQDGV